MGNSEEYIGFSAKNSAWLIENILCNLKRGKSIVLFPSRTSAYEFKGLFNSVLELSINKIFFDKETIKLSQELPTNLDCQILENNLKKEILLKKDDFKNSKSKIVFFTSGSSGKPKAVVHRLSSLIETAKASNKRTGFSSNDNWLLTLPLNHVGGFSVVLRASLEGAKIILNLRDSLIDELRNNSVDYLSLVPSQLDELLSARTPFKVKSILLGGGAVSNKLIAQIKDSKTPVLYSYGMTEAGSTISCSDGLSDFNGFGKPLEGVEVEIRNSGEQGFGEIYIRGENLFISYIGEEIREKNAWFNTGDIGRINPDGNLDILGRADKTIISGGENIHPREIEILAEKNLDVKKACVVGVKNDRWGESPVLFVESEKDISGIILEDLKGKLPSFKVPKKIFCMDRLPLLENKKINYQVLFEVAQDSIITASAPNSK